MDSKSGFDPLRCSRMLVLDNMLGGTRQVFPLITSIVGDVLGVGHGV